MSARLRTGVGAREVRDHEGSCLCGGGSRAGPPEEAAGGSIRQVGHTCPWALPGPEVAKSQGQKPQGNFRPVSNLTKRIKQAHTDSRLVGSLS